MRLDLSIRSSTDIGNSTNAYEAVIVSCATISARMFADNADTIKITSIQTPFILIHLFHKNIIVAVIFRLLGRFPLLLLLTFFRILDFFRILAFIQF